MGRTKRRRNFRIKGKKEMEISLENIQDIISLKKWMSHLGWKNHTKLILKNFRNTGRGVSSLQSIKPNQILIEIPFHLLITYATVIDSDIIKILNSSCNKFKAHDALAIFLALEKHKKEKSKWKYYLDTLPEDLPTLPWLCSEGEFSSTSSDLLGEIQKRKRNFRASWERVEKSISSDLSCLCCKKRLDRVITSNAFTWGYVMVNTRAVYIQPAIVRHLCRGDLSASLSDEPCLALCPFLDMFNHSTEANTSADLIYTGDSWNYTLTTSIFHKKHQQIFISYGAHDNATLLCEYGFFTACNFLDRIQFILKHLTNILKVNLTEKQYIFIKSRCLDNELYISIQGLSFNLKAVIYIILKVNEKWSSIIFCDNYKETDYLFMHSVINDLLLMKKKCIARDILHLQSLCNCKYLNSVVDYCKYTMSFIEELLNIGQQHK